MIFSLLLLAAPLEDARQFGPWRVTCEDGAKAGDGLFDRCRMHASIDGATIDIVRTWAGADYRAKVSGCRTNGPAPAATRTREQLTGPDGKDMFFGGVFEAIINNIRQCPRQGHFISVGGELEAAFNATANLRPPASANGAN